jgi:hypothetical protein
VAVVKNCTELYFAYLNTYFRLPVMQTNILKIPKRIGMKTDFVLFENSITFQASPLCLSDKTTSDNEG